MARSHYQSHIILPHYKVNELPHYQANDLLSVEILGFFWTLKSQWMLIIFLFLNSYESRFNYIFVIWKLSRFTIPSGPPFSHNHYYSYSLWAKSERLGKPIEDSPSNVVHDEGLFSWSFMMGSWNYNFSHMNNSKSFTILNQWLIFSTHCGKILETMEIPWRFCF